MKRTLFTWILIGVLAAAMVFAGGCRKNKGNTVSVVGSTSIQPFAEVLAQEFNASHPMQVEVQGGGSTAGLMAVSTKMAEVGMCSRALKSDETQYEPIQIAVDGLAVVVHPSNPICSLSREQIADIFAGKYSNWKEIRGLEGNAGPDRPIHVITREEGSGTREAFQKLVMHDQRIYRKAVTQESNGAVKELVRNDPATIGFMSLGLVEDLKALKVDGVAPTHETVIDKSYPLVRPFLFVVAKGAPVSKAAREFIQFVLSDKGQQMLEKEGLVRAPKDGNKIQ